MPFECYFTLVNLPSDVIRKIIRIGLESIDFMRLISHRWSDLALEHLNNRRNLPVIEWFRWRIPRINYILLSIEPNEEMLSMRLPYAFRQYFGVGNWQCHPIPSNNSTNSKVEVDSQRLFWSKEDCLLHRISRMIGRCSRIERLELNNDNVEAVANCRAIIQSIGGITVGELVLTGRQYLPENDETEILGLLQSHRVERLVLLAENFRLGMWDYLYTVTTDYIPPFFYDAVRIVQTVEIVSTELRDKRFRNALGYWYSLRDSLSRPESYVEFVPGLRVEIRSSVEEIDNDQKRYSVNMVALDLGEAVENYFCDEEQITITDL